MLVSLLKCCSQDIDHGKNTVTLKFTLKKIISLELLSYCIKTTTNNHMVLQDAFSIAA